MQPLEFISPKITHCYKEEELVLIFSISSGILFTLPLPVNQSQNCLSIIRPESFIFKQSVFVLSFADVVVDNCSAKKLHGFTDYIALDELEYIFVRNQYQISLWQLSSTARTPTRLASARIHTSTKSNSPNKSGFFSSFFANSKALDDSMEQYDTEFLTWAWQDSHLHAIQNNGLYRCWKLNNNNIFEIQDFDIARQISREIQDPEFAGLLKAKIYPVEDIMIVQWEHSDENVYFSKFSLSSQEWLNNDYIADHLELDCIKNVVDFSWDNSTKLFHVLQKDNEGNFRCVVGNEDFSEWKKVSFY